MKNTTKKNDNKKTTKSKLTKKNQDVKMVKKENSKKTISTTSPISKVSVVNKENLSLETKNNLNDFVDLELLEKYGYSGIWNKKYDESNPIILKIGKYRIKSNKSLVNVENLSMLFKIRGLYFKALNNVSFSVDEGDLFGIIGESGSGKSTTGKCIIKLHQPSGGKIEIANNLVSNKKLSKKTKKWLRKNVQMIFQDPMSSLNPTKNILQLISEPLIINKSLYKDAAKDWKLLNNISRYLYIDFMKEKNQLLNNFRFFYLTLLCKELNEVYSAIEKQDYSNLDFKDAREKLIFEMDTLVERINTTTSHVYEFSGKFESLVNSLETRYLNQDYDQSFKKYEEVEKEFKEKKDILHKSNEGRKITTDLKKAQKMLKDYKSEFDEVYHFQNHQYIKSWETTVKGQIKNIKQELHFSKDQISFSLHYANLKQKEFELLFVKNIYKNNFVNEDFINSLIKQIESTLDKLFSPILNYVSKLQEEFETADIELKNKIIDRLVAVRMIANIYVINFKNNKWNDFSFVKDEVDKILSIYPDFNLYNFEKFEDFFDFQQKLNAQLHDLFNLSTTHAKEISEAYDAEKVELQKVIESIKGKLKEILSAYKNSNKSENSEYDINKKNFDQTLNLFNEAKKDREIHINEIVKGTETINQKSLSKKSDEDFKILLGEYKIIKNKFVNLIKKHLATIKTKMINDYDGPNKLFYKLNGYKNDFSYFKKEIKLRWKSLSAIEFEYKNAIKEVETSSFVCEYSRYLNWIIYFRLFRMIKREKVYKALDSVGLKREHAYRYPHEFSGGQRQRIVIARALINDPKIIIADEPISELDVSIQAQIINILQDLSVNKKVTVLFIAHDLSMVNYACNNVIIMHRGRILEKGNVNKIFENPIHPYTRSLMKATPKLSRVHIDLAAFDEDFTYDKKWSAFNRPKFIKIKGDDHEVFGTPDQVNQWIKLAEKEHDI